MKKTTILLLVFLFSFIIVFGDDLSNEIAGIEEVECYFSISGYKSAYNVDVEDIANDLGIPYRITYHGSEYGNCVTVEGSYNCQRMRDEIASRSSSGQSYDNNYSSDDGYRESPQPTILGYILLLVLLWWLADALKSE
ncbi:MAG: hypothetical protein PHV06_11875 [bacterium]|nr:hypothetical protein [bacterium]